MWFCQNCNGRHPPPDICMEQRPYSGDWPLLQLCCCRKRILGYNWFLGRQALGTHLCSCNDYVICQGPSCSPGSVMSGCLHTVGGIKCDIPQVHECAPSRSEAILHWQYCFCSVWGVLQCLLWPSWQVSLPFHKTMMDHCEIPWRVLQGWTLCMKEEGQTACIGSVTLPYQTNPSSPTQWCW